MMDLKITGIHSNKNRSGKVVAKLFLLMVGMGLFSQIVASYLLTVVLGFFPEVAEQYANNISNLLKISPGILFSVCIIAPAIEETIFRLLIMGVATKFLGYIAGNIVQAVLFGIYHGNMVQGIYAFILGLFIGYLLHITGSILYTVAFHMGINFSGMFIDKLIPEETPEAIKFLAFVIAVAVVVAAVWRAVKVAE